MNTTQPDVSDAKLDRIFMAMADSTRRQLVRMLAEQDRTVGELAEPFQMSLAAVSKHIKVLESAGVIARRVDGRVHTLTLRPEALSGALDWIMIYRTSGSAGWLRWMKRSFTTVENRPTKGD